MNYSQNRFKQNVTNKKNKHDGDPASMDGSNLNMACILNIFVVKPDSDAMHRLQECMDASKAVCMNVQNMLQIWSSVETTFIMEQKT